MMLCDAPNLILLAQEISISKAYQMHATAMATFASLLLVIPSESWAAACHSLRGMDIENTIVGKAGT